MMTTPRRALLATAALFSLVLAATAVGVSMPAAAAQVPTVHLACTANFQLNVDPPFTTSLSPQQFDVVGQAGLAGCLPLSSQGAGLQSATAEATGAGTATLCALVTMTGSGEFTWNTGETSDFDYSVNLNLLNPETSVGFSATVTSGRLAGSTATAVPVLINLGGTCLTGVTSLQALFAEVLFTG